MKRWMAAAVAAALGLCVAGCAPGKKPGYVDLPGDRDSCAAKVFPREAGRGCASGELDHFTIRRLTDFGERPVWSPDGKKIAFIGHEFGDAYELDLASGATVCLTCPWATQGFLRIHYLKDGDYLLLGPRKWRGRTEFTNRVFHTGFYWMPADYRAPPYWLGEEHYEGVAVSRESRQIAYSKTWLDTPLMFPSRMYVAEVGTEGELFNRHVVYRSAQLIEAQDFLPGDRGLTFTRYTPNYEALGVDFATDKAVNYSRSPASEEAEGLFPDGAFTLIESDRHAMKPGDMDLELYMLRLDGTGQDVRRLTHFTDVSGEKASNPAVSPEGCRIAFMKARPPDHPGQLTGAGAGIFLLEFHACP